MKAKTIATRLKRSGVVLAAMGAGVAPQIAQAQCRPPEEKLGEILNVRKTPDVLVLAHRGYWGKYAGLASMPENSLGAVDAANAACVDGIELDVKMTWDRVPILMHDFNLGRTTNVWEVAHGEKYDPLTNRGINPKVDSWTAVQIDRLQILTPDRQRQAGFAVPRVQQVIDIWASRGMRTPLVFDTKTAEAVRAIDAIVARRIPGNGINVMAVKVNATLYPDPKQFYADAKNVNVIPVFTTNMLGKISVHTSLEQWSRTVGTIEINVKQPRGLLSYQMGQARSAGKRVGVFQAIPDGPRAGQFYRATGECCYRLADLYYHHKVMGQPAGSDTDDQRGDINFINREGFGLVTTDDPKGAVEFLARAGKRQTHSRSF